VQLQRKGKLVPVLPRVFRQQDRTRGEIGERRGVGGSGLGALACEQMSSASCSRSSPVVTQGGAAVELIDDFEDGLFTFLRRRMRREQPSHAEVRLGAQPFGYE